MMYRGSPAIRTATFGKEVVRKKVIITGKKKKKKTLYYIASRARQDSATFGCKGSTCTGIKVEHI
jgi:hypothetical protein